MEISKFSFNELTQYYIYISEKSTNIFGMLKKGCVFL